MRHFAFFKEIFFSIGDFFTWMFQILPVIGIVANWIMVFILVSFLVYWCMRIIGFGNEDKRVVDYRQPHNFID